MSYIDALLTPRKADRLMVAWGDVTVADPLTVRFAGDTAGTNVKRRLSVYTPVAGDRVVLLRVGSSWIVIGNLV